MKIKYSLNINQLAFYQHFPELDLVDAAIFCFLWDFERAANKLSELQGQYFEASPGLILQQMPILGMKSKRAVQKRIGNLVEAGLLERHEKTQAKGRSWLRFTEKATLIYYTQPPNESSQGANQNSETPERKFAAPPNESSQYNTNKYNTTTDKKTPPEKKAATEFERKYGAIVQELTSELKAVFEGWGEKRHVRNAEDCIRLMIQKDGEDPSEIRAVIQWLKQRGPCRNERGQFQVFGFPAFRQKYRNAKKGNGGLRSHYIAHKENGSNGNKFEQRGISAEGLFRGITANE